MSETTIKKVKAATAPKGDLGQRYLVSGKQVSLRLWEERAAAEPKSLTARDYETVGYVISGKARLELEDQTIVLEPGDSWLVPATARHRYTILEPLTAVEATAPPAQIHGRDE